MIATRVKTLDWQCDNTKIKTFVEGIMDKSFNIHPKHQREFIASKKWKKDLIHSWSYSSHCLWILE